MKKQVYIILLSVLSFGGSAQNTFPSSGNAGIGTSAPRSPLEIRTVGNNNTVQTGIIIQQYNPNTPNNSAGISLDFGIGNNDGNNNIMGKITLKETWYALLPKMLFSLWDANNIMQDRMVIDTYGNAGIGTSTPDQRLTVNGKIKCEEVQVVVDVPADYVFETEYKLPPLPEVDHYIQQNKHLPGMPNAQALKTNGWNVGEMNNKLLEKIEELTLYMIELKKENEELKLRVNNIERTR